jgi:prepilin-type N-terminal cleavage/methylation domain-containing protein
MTKKFTKNGFTLVEVLVALIAASILGSLLITFMQSVFSKTGQSIQETAAVHHVSQVMDNITALYMSHLNINISAGANIGDMLGVLDENISETNNNSLGSFKAEKTWYDSPPFDSGGSSARGNSSRFLKIRVIDPSSPSVSVTSVFWSGK